ncbi:MAG: uracil-DNA glycosylase [Bdellovibrionales bacterium]|nr:uracil-DNA glycosylase [Bdellovibrionales bacterium]
MSLKSLNARITGCKKCPRLRKHCLEIARVKRRAFADETYYGLPITGFGDTNARVLIIGLAPAAHGANRTGRMFTGDNSGLWLYRALHRAGFANQAESTSRNDGLKLIDVYVAATARCAPPQNKLTLKEVENCRPYLIEEMELLKNQKVIIVLGLVALKSLWAILPDDVKPSKALPKFKHGFELKLNGGRVLLGSYHPSQQNTFTKKLTEPMFDAIFNRARELIDQNNCVITPS